MYGLFNNDENSLLKSNQIISLYGRKIERTAEILQLFKPRYLEYMWSWLPSTSSDLRSRNWPNPAPRQWYLCHNAFSRYISYPGSPWHPPNIRYIGDRYHMPAHQLELSNIFQFSYDHTEHFQRGWLRFSNILDEKFPFDNIQAVLHLQKIVKTFSSEFNSVILEMIMVSRE